MLLVSLLLSVIASAKGQIALPVYNPSFEDWNDSYYIFDDPLWGEARTTTVPTGWNLEPVGSWPCHAVVKSNTSYSARTGEYAAFFDDSSTSITSDEYTLTEGTYSFNVYAANIGYGGTVINLQVEGAVTKKARCNVTGKNGVYNEYSISFDMETRGTVKFKIDNRKEWDGVSSMSHFAIDDWSLTTDDGELIGIETPNVYTDGDFSYYLYGNGEAELSIVNNKDIAGVVEIPETISYNGKTYLVRSIAPYSFCECNGITSVVYPKRLYTIGNHAFYGCENLVSVVFPTYLKSIGEEAFASCPNLDEAVFMTKRKPSLSVGVFGISTKLFVSRTSDYSEFGDRVQGLAYVNEDVIYSGEKPTIELQAPTNVAIKSCDIKSLGVQCGKYTLEAEFESFGMEVEGEVVVNILPAKLNIIAPTVTKCFGEENPQIELSYDGFVNGESSDVLIAEPSITFECTDRSDIGKYPINVTNAVAANYLISYTSGSIIVHKRPLMVKIKDCQITYGQNIPDFEIEYSGLASFETTPKWDSSPQLVTEAKNGSDVGKYDISIQCNPHNYTVETQNGTLSIIKAPLVLKASNANRLYYSKNPDFTFSLTGLKCGDDESCLTTAPLYTCPATIESNSGQYDIIPFGAAAKNYSIEYRGGILSVSPRQLIASVEDYTKDYGTDNPQFEVKCQGFVNNEDESVLLIPVTATCQAEKNSDAGSYPIILSGGDAVNYVFSEYNHGTLFINKVNQTLTWNQDLSNVTIYSQIALDATSSAGLPVTYEMSPNNVVTLFDNAGIWYLDCFGIGTVNVRAVQNGDKNHMPATMISKRLVVNDGGGNPTSPQIFVNIEEPGTLPTLISETKKYQIENLRLSGILNGTDIRFLRDMAGSDSYGNATPGVLEILDISNSTIVSGGESYYDTYMTSYNAVSDYMFYNCKSLTNLRLPDNMESIGNGAFADCERLSVIAIPNDVVSFGQQAFKNCTSLLRIPMPNQLTSIGDLAFTGCNGITEIMIPKSVSYIGDGIVKDCPNIERINVESGNANFASKDGVLYTSSFEELLIFPVGYTDENYAVLESATRIAPFAFVNAKKLQNLTLPETMTSIGKDAFKGSVNLSTLRVRAITPPICDNDCFESVSKTRCELQVPQGCYSYYWVAPVWSDFNKIVESTYSGVTDMESEQPKISIDDHNIIINGFGKGHNIRIFQTDGSILYQYISDGNDVRYQPSANGIYIVVIDDSTFKVVLR